MACFLHRWGKPRIVTTSHWQGKILVVHKVGQIKCAKCGRIASRTISLTRSARP